MMHGYIANNFYNIDGKLDKNVVTVLLPSLWTLEERFVGYY
jgi:hypothetical protein